jgi:serine/threonine-protein kinase
MLSANNTVEDVVQGLDAGADDYLTKPVLMPELLARLRVAERTLGYQHEMSRQVDELKDAINGRYVPELLIGYGGLGAVYRGRDRLLQRSVAIKILQRDVKNNPKRDLWDAALSEAMLTANIRHKNIITMYDCGQNAQGAFMVMELFEGKNLAEIIDEQGQIPLPLFRNIALQTLSALKAAHELNILHCDLKPSNIMIRLEDATTGDVDLRILDFGLAKLKGQVYSNDDEDCVLVSIHYLCPEAIVGQTLDARSDLYSLGHMFFHCLAGRPSYFHEDSAEEIARAHLKGDYPNLCELNPEVTPELKKWLDGMMAHSKEKRYNSVDRALSEFRCIGQRFQRLQ